MQMNKAPPAESQPGALQLLLGGLWRRVGLRRGRGLLHICLVRLVRRLQALLILELRGLHELLVLLVRSLHAGLVRLVRHLQIDLVGHLPFSLQSAQLFRQLLNRRLHTKIRLLQRGLYL